MRSKRVLRRNLLLAATLLVGGCVERVMTIKTDPPDALVYLNGQELGRTPVTRDFTWYGNYDVQIRREGYDPVLTHRWVVAPWFQWVPFDLFAEVMPFHIRDHQTIAFVMHPTTQQAVNIPQLLARSEAERAQLEGSRYTPPPTTRAAAVHTTTRPSTRPASVLPPTTAPVTPR